MKRVARWNRTRSPPARPRTPRQDDRGAASSHGEWRRCFRSRSTSSTRAGGPCSDLALGVHAAGFEELYQLLDARLLSRAARWRRTAFSLISSTVAGMPRVAEGGARGGCAATRRATLRPRAGERQAESEGNTEAIVADPPSDRGPAPVTGRSDRLTLPRVSRNGAPRPGRGRRAPVPRLELAPENGLRERVLTRRSITRRRGRAPKTSYPSTASRSSTGVFTSRRASHRGAAAPPSPAPAARSAELVPSERLKIRSRRSG
jgi:hypothetical protein